MVARSSEVVHFETLQIQPDFVLENPSTGEKEQEISIFDYYSIENEVHFLRRIQDLPLAERNFYIRENVVGFLGEFVGEIPYKKIPYLLKDYGLDYAGLPIMDTYRQTAQMAGVDSREWFETRGMKQVEEAFLNTNSLPINVATVISPPKIADYGFVFHFVKEDEEDEELQAHRIFEYILRYPERRGCLEKSGKILDNFTTCRDYVGSYYKTTEDFLERPILAWSQNPGFDLKIILERLGISGQDIEKAKEFETVVSQKLSNWIEQYFEGVLELAQLEDGSLKYKFLLGNIKLLFGAIYNKAKEMKKDLEDEKEDFLRRREDFWRTDPSAMIFYYANAQPLTVKGGGSCPITRPGFESSGFLSVIDIYNSLNRGTSVERLLQSREDFSAETKGQIRCPECGWTPNEQEKEQLKSGELTRCPGSHPDGRRCGWDPCTKRRS